MDNKKYTHVIVKDENGSDFLCPAGTGKGGKETDLDLNVCFEKDVPERYAGNIHIKDA